MTDILLILVVAAVVFAVARADFTRGLCVGVFLLVLLPTDLRIDTGGALPEITVHRIILVLLVLFWLRQPQESQRKERIPFIGILVALACSRGVSFVLSTTPAASFKDLIAFIMETVIFYRMVSACLTDSQVSRALLRAVAYALLVVAMIAAAEKYAKVSLPAMLISQFRYFGDAVQSTYPSRILLGYAMAMGTPLILGLMDSSVFGGRRKLLWLTSICLVAACYFSTSRGPWLGMALACGLCLALGSARARKRLLVVACLTLATMVVRPGVQDTILNLARATFNSDDIKGASYEYRWKLWSLAFHQLQLAPERVPFGYGGLSTESMDLSDFFGSQEGGSAFKLGYTSWDNQYASDLVEFGVVGFALEATLFALIAVKLARRWRGASGEERWLLGGVVAGCAVFLFAQTNVYIFSAQLRFLFLTLVAIGCAPLSETVPPAAEELAAVADQDLQWSPLR